MPLVDHLELVEGDGEAVLYSMPLGSDPHGKKTQVVERFPGDHFQLDILGDGCLPARLFLPDHFVTLPVEAEDVVSHRGGSYPAHLGNLSIWQNFPVEAFRRVISVFHQGPYLVRA